MSADARQAALDRQAQLTKPPGSLGRLEDIAVSLAAIQRSAEPRSRPAVTLLFASDHPVAARGVSAYPPSVTVAMLANFASCGAASTVFARALGVDLRVYDVGVSTDGAAQPHDGDTVRRVRADALQQVGDLSVEPAMSAACVEAAMQAGRDAVADACASSGDALRVLLLGEMGIGNTTPATAIACATLQRPAAALTGPGTGVAGDALQNKIRVLEVALARVDELGIDRADGREVLRQLGGREIAAMTGAMLEAASRGVAVLVDGFVVSSAALAACAIAPSCRDVMLFAHRSQEPAHRLVLEHLGAEWLLDLGLRLGEGTGALAAMPLLDLACAMHNDMATFAEANVDGPS